MPSPNFFRWKSSRSRTAGRRPRQARRRLQGEALEQRSLLTASSLAGTVPIGPPIDPAQGLNPFVGNQYSAVAMAPNGDYVVAWERGSTSGNEQVYACPYFADGEPKAGAVAVSPSGGVDYHPRVGMAADGSFVVTWTDNSTDLVHYRRFAADGSAKDASGVVVDATGNAQGLSDVAMYADGGFVVAWDDNIIYSSPQVGFRYFSADGTPGTPVMNATLAKNPHVTVRKGVGAVVTWQSPDNSSGSSQLWAQSYSASGGENPAVMVANDVGTGKYIEDSAVSMNDSGNFAVVRTHHYSDFDHETYVDVRNFQGTRIGSAAVRVDTSQSPGFLMHPAVALADDNSFAVSYDNSSQSRAWYKLFDSSQNVIASGDVDAGQDGGFVAGARAGYTALAMNGAGRFVVSWHQDPNADSLNQVQVRKFHADIAPVTRDDVYVLSSAAASSVSTADGMLVNDSDPWGVASHLQAGYRVTDPTLGSLSHWHEAGSLSGTFTYTKGSNFQYVDRFTYQAYDLDSNHPGNVATVTLLSQPAAVVWKFYNSVLNRTPDDGGLKFWADYLTHGGQTGQMAVGFFESDELLNSILGNYYQQFLLRPLDATGLAYWKGVWHATGGPEGIKAGFAASPEFYQSAGGTPDHWIDALYQRVLSRSPDPSGRQYWLDYYQQHVAAGADAAGVKSGIALGFFDSHEAFANDVTGWYSEYLQRAPSTAEQNQFAAQMQSGASDRSIEQEITNLPEYGANPPTPPSGVATRLPNYYKH